MTIPNFMMFCRMKSQIDSQFSYDSVGHDSMLQDLKCHSFDSLWFFRNLILFWFNNNIQEIIHLIAKPKISPQYDSVWFWLFSIYCITKFYISTSLNQCHHQFQWFSGSVSGDGELWAVMNLVIMDDPVDVELRCSSHHQVLLLTGDEVTVDGELHGGGVMGLTEHCIHPDSSAGSQPGRVRNTGISPKSLPLHIHYSPKSHPTPFTYTLQEVH